MPASSATTSVIAPPARRMVAIALLAWSADPLIARRS